jgi:hypothetical protein
VCQAACLPCVCGFVRSRMASSTHLVFLTLIYVYTSFLHVCILHVYNICTCVIYCRAHSICTTHTKPPSAKPSQLEPPCPGHHKKTSRQHPQTSHSKLGPLQPSKQYPPSVRAPRPKIFESRACSAACLPFNVPRTS